MVYRFIHKEVKDLIVQDHLDGYSMEDIVKLRDVDRHTVNRVLKTYREYGTSVKPRQRISGRPRILTKEHLDYLRELLEAKPTRTLRELQELLKGKFNVDVDTSTIHRRLVADGISCKKLQQEGDEGGVLKTQPRTAWSHVVKGFLTPIPENERHPALNELEYFPPIQMSRPQLQRPKQRPQLPRSKASQKRTARRPSPGI